MLVVFRMLAVVLVFIGVARADATPRVFITPDSICAGPPESQFHCSIMLDGAGDSLGCFHILLHYDRSRLRLSSATEGDLFHNAGSTLFIWESPGIDTTAFTDCLLGHRRYVLGPGELVKLVFKVVGCGANYHTPLQLVTHRTNPPPADQAYLADINRLPISGVTWQGRSATICNGCNASADDPTGDRGASLSLSPIPAFDRLRFQWTLPTGDERGWITVFAASGRKVFSYAIVGREDHLVWDLRDDHGEPIPSGAYFVRMTCDRGDLIRRILRIR
jgi:hypothetical protein